MYEYRTYCRESLGFADKTVEEHLRALAKITALAGHIAFAKYTSDQIVAFKNGLRATAVDEGEDGRAWSTVDHTLRTCAHFLKWFIETDRCRQTVQFLTGDFNLSRREARLSGLIEKRDVPTADELWKLIEAIGSQTPALRCKQALVALIACTGMRIGSAITLRGGDIDQDRRRIHQNPKHVRSRASKEMKTRIVAWDPRISDCLDRWLDERQTLGFNPYTHCFRRTTT